MTKYFKVENERIYELPADVVEVVRCKDCVFAEVDAEAEMCRCRNHSFPCWTKTDDFCSYGEREGE